MVLSFLGLAGNIEDHVLEKSPSCHRQIAPELLGACQQQTFEVQAEWSVWTANHIASLLLCQSISRTSQKSFDQASWPCSSVGRRGPCRIVASKAIAPPNDIGLLSNVLVFSLLWYLGVNLQLTSFSLMEGRPVGVRGGPLEFLRISPLANNESSSSTSSSSSRFLKVLGFLVAEGVLPETFFLFLLRHMKIFKIK